MAFHEAILLEFILSNRRKESSILPYFAYMSTMEVQTKVSCAQSNLITSKWICLPKSNTYKQEKADQQSYNDFIGEFPRLPHTMVEAEGMALFAVVHTAKDHRCPSNIIRFNYVLESGRGLLYTPTLNLHIH
ncbi:hypothetical protein KSP39_PZI003618 [Platanthera zijinensis]|uniref:Uncharacterized protein n=1 Tax=Platanthera zijinensis TaxID=2320716 RepID=A0AAP0BY13_9ASPA